MRELESKNLHLRRKLSSVEEESVSVMQENRQLIIELEAVNLELASSKTKVFQLMQFYTTSAIINDYNAIHAGLYRGPK